MRGTLHPNARRLLGCAAGAIVLGCTSDQQPDRATREGAAGSAGGRTRSTAPGTRTAVCERTADGEAGDLALARCLATPELAPAGGSPPLPVTVYFDRSGSMRGFLDPSYPTRVRTDYRSVIDRLVVGLAPTRGYSFGAELRAIEPTLATLGDRGFYSDRDTRTEQALAVVARDSAAAASHIIIGDGRRGSPGAGDAQYVRMREVADRWIDNGGSFIVAASLAPFTTVASDPSGCRVAVAGATGSNGTPQTCPLYAFGFIATGDAQRVVATLAGVFEHIFVWPAPGIPPADLAITPRDPHRRDVRVERRWASGTKGTPIVRVRGDSATNRTLAASITVRDTSTPAGSAHAAILAGQDVAIRTFSRGFTPAAAAQEWMPVEARGALVRPGTDSTTLSLDFVTRGARAPKSMYRIDLMPGGEPAWLEQFDAEDASDVLRTYGLGRLFESFRVRAKGGSAVPIGRLFIVAS